jgi:hypothetical protein
MHKLGRTLQQGSMTDYLRVKVVTSKCLTFFKYLPNSFSMRFCIASQSTLLGMLGRSASCGSAGSGALAGLCALPGGFGGLGGWCL